MAGRIFFKNFEQMSNKKDFERTDLTEFNQVNLFLSLSSKNRLIKLLKRASHDEDDDDVLKNVFGTNRLDSTQSKTTSFASRTNSPKTVLDCSFVTKMCEERFCIDKIFVILSF